MIHAFAFILGSFFGSFINALIYRIPRNKDIVFCRSQCPKCSHIIYWYHNLPILSYYFLRGCCAYCKGKIPLRYVLIEITAGLVTLLLFPKEYSNTEWINFLFNIAVFYTFLAITFIDLDFKIIPNRFNVFLAILFLVSSFQNLNFTKITLGILLGGGFPLFITWLFYTWRGKIGLGGGDIKLFAALGIHLGPLEIIRTIFLSCFLGSLTVLIFIGLKKMDKDKPIPFGPFIILIASLQIFMPDAYSRLMEFLIP